MEGGGLLGGSAVLAVTDEEGGAARDAAKDLGARLLTAAVGGDVNGIRALLDHPSADPAAMLMHADSACGSSALTLASWKGNVGAMRLLLEHPAADPGVMITHADYMDSTALLEAAMGGHVDAMRLLLDHPAADATALMAARENYFGRHVDNANDGRPAVSALIAAASFAAAGPVSLTGVPAPAFYASESAVQTLPLGDCAPLLFLLRRVAVEPHPSAAQQAHMSAVMEAMCEGPPSRSRRLLDDDQPDAVREACVRLLLEHGARFDLDDGMVRVGHDLASWAWRFAGSD
jgi:hypothetical protein